MLRTLLGALGQFLRFGDSPFQAGEFSSSLLFQALRDSVPLGALLVALNFYSDKTALDALYVPHLSSCTGGGFTKQPFRSGVPVPSLRRQTRSAWPVLMTLGNFTQATSSSAAATRFIALMQFPKRRETDPVESYRVCTATLFLRFYRAIVQLVENWAGGFWLTLLGRDGGPSIIVPRIGLFLGDLLEIRAIAAVIASCSARCTEKVGKQKAGGEDGSASEGSDFEDAGEDLEERAEDEGDEAPTAARDARDIGDAVLPALGAEAPPQEFLRLPVRAISRMPLYSVACVCSRVCLFVLHLRSVRSGRPPRARLCSSSGQASKRRHPSKNSQLPGKRLLWPA